MGDPMCDVCGELATFCVQPISEVLSERARTVEVVRDYDDLTWVCTTDLAQVLEGLEVDSSIVTDITFDMDGDT